MEEIQQSFNEKTAFICAICYAEMDCKDEIEALPCLHEYHYMIHKFRKYIHNTLFSFFCFVYILFFFVLNAAFTVFVS